MSDERNQAKPLTHVCGSFLVEARGAFLNGAGLGAGEDRTTTIPKTFREGKNQVPYVSAQAWRRWLRNTLISETGWDSSEIQSIAWNSKGNTSKVSGQVNPVDFAEDDLFGYMRAAEGQGKRKEKDDAVDPSVDDDDEDADDDASNKIVSVMRASPLATSILASIRAEGWEGKDDGYVHVQTHNPEALELEEWLRTFGELVEKKLLEKKGLEDLKKAIKGMALDEKLKRAQEFATNLKLTADARVAMSHPHSPLPYSTRFFNTHLEAVFALDHGRVGVFWDLGDRVELDRDRTKGWLKDKKITVREDRGLQGKIYQLTDRNTATARSRALLRALAVLRGGAKQAAFATDVAPKALILAGLSCGNPIFNRLFKDTPKGPELDLARLKELVKDYGPRITTPVFVGIREGYLANQEKVKEADQSGSEDKPWTGTGERRESSDPQLRGSLFICTPVEAANHMAEIIP
jgi:CRISPR/Cas system-associated protein Cas7 (RAMP superfamily)